MEQQSLYDSKNWNAKKALFCLWVCRHCAVRVFEFISFASLLLLVLLLFCCCTRMECLSFHHSSASTSSSSFSSSSLSSLSFHHYFIISSFVMCKKMNAARLPIYKWLSIWVDERRQKLICGWGFEFKPSLCFPLGTCNCGMPVAHDLKVQLFKALQSTYHSPVGPIHATHSPPSIQWCHAHRISAAQQPFSIMNCSAFLSLFRCFYVQIIKIKFKDRMKQKFWYET